VKLLVVISNYRITDLTIDCLRSLDGRIQKIPGSRVAVCENGTGPEDAARLREAIPANGWQDWVDLTVVYPNRGFTGGNNVILREALASADPPEYVLLLNADTIVLDGALEGLVDFMERHPDVGIAGSTLVSAEGEVQGSPFRFISVASEFDRALRLGAVSRLLSRWRVVMPKPPAAAPVDWVSGASLILRREVLERVGLLDEGLYTYFDDVDYCLRAKKLGFSTWFVPESRIVHLEGRSTGLGTGSVRRRPSYWFQARRRFFLKNHGPVYAALADAAFILGFGLWRVRRRIQGKPDPDPPHFLSDFVRESVFVAGFRVSEVENPALAKSPSGGAS